MSDAVDDRVLRPLTDQLLALAGLSPTGPELRFDGPATVLASSYRVTDAATALVAAVSVAVARVGAARASASAAGPVGSAAITVDTVGACAAFQSERHLQVVRADDGSPTDRGALWDGLSGHYEAADGHVQFHTNFPHHRAGLLAALGCGPDAGRATVEAEVRRRNRFDLEREVSAAGGIAAAVRTEAEWEAHPHAAHIAGRPPLTIRSIETPGVGASGFDRPAPPDRPLAGIRVLDLTRVIAGPVCGRTLAAYGAEVLRIGADRLPVVDALLPDTTLGKRFAHCDLTTTAGIDRLLSLAAEADVVVGGFRPGALAGLGLDHERLLAANPSLVQATLSAFGADGPWGGRRGFDSITQSATGIVAEETLAFGSPRPRPLPCQLLDHGSGFLLALGVLAALLRRAGSGDGQLVEASLVTTRQWLASLGRTDATDGSADWPAEVEPLLEERLSPWGRIRHVGHPGRIDGVAARWDRGPARPGADEPRWLLEAEPGRI